MRTVGAMVVAALAMACGTGAAVPGCTVTTSGDISGAWPCTRKLAFDTTGTFDLGNFDLEVQLESEAPFFIGGITVGQALAVRSYAPSDGFRSDNSAAARINSEGKAWVLPPKGLFSLQISDLGTPQTSEGGRIYPDIHGTLSVTLQRADGPTGLVNVTANF